MSKSKYKFEVGDTLEAQGARLTVVGRFLTAEGRPAYEMVSPFTVGEPWLVDETFLATARKIRKKKISK